MNEVRVQVTQRLQHKAPLSNSGVRYCQHIGREDQVLHKEDIKIERAWPPPFTSNPPQCVLDALQHLQKLRGRELCPQSKCGVEI